LLGILVLNTFFANVNIHVNADPTVSCDVPVIYFNNYPQFGETLYNCSDNMPSNQEALSYFIGQPAVNISIEFVLNDLVSVDDITQTIVFDCKFRIQWYDSRWDVPQLFEVLNPNEVVNGIEINQFVRSDARPLHIWLPNMHFVDAQIMETMGETIRIKENGKIYWSRHVLLTVSQAQMEFRQYPMDYQNFAVRFEPYSLPSTMLNIEEAKVRLYDNNGAYNFEKNAMWSLDSFSIGIYNLNYGSATTPRYFSSGTLFFNMTRRSKGLIFRLAIPILFILVLAGFIFWAAVDSRFDSTITLLLAISALYIVIFGNIPMLGKHICICIFSI